MQLHCRFIATSLIFDVIAAATDCQDSGDDYGDFGDYGDYGSLEGLGCEVVVCTTAFANNNCNLFRGDFPFFF